MKVVKTGMEPNHISTIFYTYITVRMFEAVGAQHVHMANLQNKARTMPVKQRPKGMLPLPAFFEGTDGDAQCHNVWPMDATLHRQIGVLMVKNVETGT